jgi:alanine racemase
MFRKTYADIQIDNLEYNITQIRNHLSPGTFFCPMVKANAYGHGDVAVAKALEIMGVQSMGVCLIEEGLLLRQFGVNAEILVFRGFDLNGARRILEQKLTPVVSDWSHFEALDQIVGRGSSLPEFCQIHIKFNTGMNRLGFGLEEAQEVLEYVKERKKFQVRGILTHLYKGEDGIHSEGRTAEQLRRFSELRAVFGSLNPIFHALNSGGVISQIQLKKYGHVNAPLTTFPWGVRPGLMIYGYNPLDNTEMNYFERPDLNLQSQTEAWNFSLKPVMTLKSSVSVFRSVPRGEGVSYNHTWKASRDSVIAVVPIGYADGLHRILSNNTSVLFGGKRVPIVGNICMDFLMLDVTDIEFAHGQVKNQKMNSAKKASAEAEVVFFGEDALGNRLSAAEQARAAGTISWEVLTSIGERVPRVYHSTNKKILELL